jgi:5-formyltetrahydrofolate cyclo-ligase
MDHPAGDGADKQSLRAAVLAARRRLTDEQRATAAAAIAAHLLAAPIARVPRVACYLSMGTEPPTETLIDGLLDRGTEVIVPVTGPDYTLEWVLHDPAAGLAVSPIGVPEPDGPRLGAGALADAGLVIVPALAVDHHGWRLGRGAGYYDRALTTATAPICALIYAAELIGSVPHEPHDVRVNLAITEAGVFRVP